MAKDKNRPGKSTILVYVDDSLKDAIKVCAKKEHRSVTNLINKIMIDYVEEHYQNASGKNVYKTPDEKECI